MSKDVQARIFDPFYTTKGTAGGSGLGLAMVQGFARQSEGAVRAYSEVGTGTTIKLYIPADAGEDGPDGPASHVEPQSGSQPEPGRAARILVVDDQVEILNMLVRTLSTAGYTVVPATSGDAALDLFRQDGEFDAVLTDIAMPGALQGPALAREVREIAPEMPVVFLTGYAAEATVHGNGLRADDIRLMKPATKDDLLSAIEEAIARR